MKETTNEQQARSAAQSTVWGALISSAIAAAIGGLLAVLVCVPYDQLFGLPTALCAGLKYTASVAVFATGLSSGRPAGQPLVYQVGHT